MRIGTVEKINCFLNGLLPFIVLAIFEYYTTPLRKNLDCADFGDSHTLTDQNSFKNSVSSKFRSKCLL